MRRSLLGLAVLLLGGSMVPGEARAQANFNGTAGTDPFYQYYGFYLPRQAALAMQPGPEAQINAITAERQRYATTNRSQLYDPVSPFSDSDALDDEGRSRRPERLPRLQTPGMNSNSFNGAGPTGYYGRTARYYPGARPGRGPNRNLAQIQPRRGGGAGPSMPAGGAISPR